LSLVQLQLLSTILKTGASHWFELFVFFKVKKYVFKKHKKSVNAKNTRGGFFSRDAEKPIFAYPAATAAHNNFLPQINC
jgi:hypothetical protein